MIDAFYLKRRKLLLPVSAISVEKKLFPENEKCLSRIKQRLASLPHWKQRVKAGVGVKGGEKFFRGYAESAPGLKTIF